jgi:hypothetical protein
MFSILSLPSPLSFFRLLLPFLFPLFALSAYAQVKTDYKTVDAIARSVPDSVEQNIALLSDYFSTRITAKKDLLRAFYFWTAHEISYDVENMYNPKPVVNRGKLITEILHTRKAVCQGYSEVFAELCKNNGIECYLVNGYTKQQGVVMPLSHTWVLARPDTGWFFFDPTWASGYVNNAVFTPRFNNDYFMVPPAASVKTHMPFDPMWQCLSYPLKAEDFYNDLTPKPDPQRYFAFADSILAYNALPVLPQYEATLRRVEANGVVNNNIGEYVRLLRHNIGIEQNNKEVLLRNDLANRFNDAVNYFNTATLLFNDYVSYWNKQFKPLKPDDQIRQMMDTCVNSMERSRKMLEEITPREESLQQNKEMLTKSMLQLGKQIDSHRGFLREYFATPKMQRPNLFRTYRF